MSHTYAFNGFSSRTPRVPFWQASIILTGAFAIALSLAVLASGLFLLMLPVVVVGAFVYRFLGLRRESIPRPDPDVIEGEFVVVSDEPADDKTPPLDEEPRQK